MPLQPESPEARGEIHPPIVFSDAEIVLVDKPSGMPSVPARNDRDPPSVVERLAGRFGPVEAVHRLDRDTSGLLLLARTRSARSTLGRAFELRKVRKRYLAIACGSLPAAAGTLHLPLGDDPLLPPRKRIDPLSGRRATTRWRLIATACVGGSPVSLVALEPVTGRSHQLRAHLAWLGATIIGDRLYSDRAGVYLQSAPLALLAARLEFPHPSNGRWIDADAAVPSGAAWSLFGPEHYRVGRNADASTCDQ